MLPLQPILLVDDDANDVYLTQRAFEQSQFGHPIDVARDGVEALDYLYCRGAFALRASGLPAVVLLDLRMPRLDGLEVLRTIKRDEQLRAVPVVVLTSAPTDPYLVQCYAHGANAYVIKPVGPSGFLEIMKAIGLVWMLFNRAPTQNPAPA